MNERIKELAQEVFSFKYKTDPNELNPGHHMDHLHKFAELIVRECIETINGVPNGYVDYRNQIEDAMREACVDAVKQKFGVE